MFDMSVITPRVLTVALLHASAEFNPDDVIVFALTNSDTNATEQIEVTACEFVGKCICELIHSGEIPNYYGATVD